MTITNRRIVDTSGSDFYPTPDWATDVFLQHEKLEGNVWEPACGTGHMSEVLKKHNYKVYSSDLYDRGYVDSFPSVDFLAMTFPKMDNIITNPPFNLAEDFVKKGLELSNKKLCLLLRLSFLESRKRYNTIYSKTPPSRVWCYSERITFYPDGIKTAGSGTIAYAWFVWDKQDTSGKTEIRWLPPR